MGWQEALDQAVPDGAHLSGCASVTLEPEPRSARSARQFVATSTAEFLEQQDALLLLTSELVTNVVVHARTAMEVIVAFTEVDIIVAVFDLDLGRSEQSGSDREGGRGLQIVQGMSLASGMVRHSDGGKTAWFRVAQVAA